MRRLTTGTLGSGCAAAVIAAASLFAGSAQAQDLTEASLRLKWLASAQFAGYYVAKEKGWYEEEGIDLSINPGGPNIIGENMVASGTDTFGHAGGGATLLQARSKGLPLIGIGMLFQETPYRFVALPDSGIEEFQDLEGKTVSTWFTGPQFILQGVLRKEGVPVEDVNIQAQAASMVPFTEGKVDVATVTVYNELQVLKREGVTDLVMFNPAEMGVNLPNEVLIVNETTAEESPELVQGFLNASLRGWLYAFENPEEAVDTVMEAAPNANRQDQEDTMRELPKLMLYDKGASEGIGYIDREALAFTNEFLVENGVIDEPVDVENAIDTSFWENVPAEYKKADN